MPCNMHNDSTPCDWCPNKRYAVDDFNRARVPRLEAMLCAALATLVRSGNVAIPEDILTEAGVGIQEIENWYTEHQREDRIRRYRDRLEAKLKAEGKL